MRILERPASATLNEPVKVSTLINPSSTPEIGSCGPITRLEVFPTISGMASVLS
jgi:hypothetical protein